MPIIKSAIKRAKQTVVRRDRNVATKRALKDATKAFKAAPTAATLSAVQSALDVAVKKNVLEKNTASRRKAQYSKIAKDSGVKFSPTKKAAPKTAAKAVVKPAAKATAKPAAKAAAKPAAKTAAKPAAKKAPAKKPAAKK